jgi:hypothetical protein
MWTIVKANLMTLVILPGIGLAGTLLYGIVMNLTSH